jgi:hypothetical protein
MMERWNKWDDWGGYGGDEAISAFRWLVKTQGRHGRASERLNESMCRRQLRAQTTKAETRLVSSHRERSFLLATEPTLKRIQHEMMNVYRIQFCSRSLRFLGMETLLLEPVC